MCGFVMNDGVIKKWNGDLGRAIRWEKAYRSATVIFFLIHNFSYLLYTLFCMLYVNHRLYFTPKLLITTGKRDKDTYLRC